MNQFKKTYGPRYPVQKWGVSTNSDMGVTTDIWDGANVADNQPIWLAPTGARIHQLSSSDVADTMNITIWALTDWDTPEQEYSYTLNGTTNVPTDNFVMINRMRAVDNVGKIKAIADIDGTTTSQIEIGNGQTEQAIYGISSTETLSVSNYYCSIVSNPTSFTKAHLMICDSPDIDPTKFRLSNNIGVGGGIQSPPDFIPEMELEGAIIIKIASTSDTNNSEISAGFNGYRF